MSQPEFEPNGNATVGVNKVSPPAKPMSLNTHDFLRYITIDTPVLRSSNGGT